MKKIALLIYPDFSMQEVSNLLYLMRWNYNVETVTVSINLDPVRSEEGLILLPEITLEEFKKEDYHALVLSGMSNFIPTVFNQEIINFLRGFQGDDEFPIGAICSGPLLLSLAGLLDEKKFINSLYVEMNEEFACVNTDNLVYEAVVVDKNIVTAIGKATRLFAIELSKVCGFEADDKMMLESVIETYKEEDYKHHLDDEGHKMMKEVFKDLL